MPDIHPDKVQIALFVSGRLDEAASDAVLQHIVECDACMELAEAAWQNQPVGTALQNVGRLDAEKARQMESRLLRRIHRSDLGGAVIGFGIGGFSNVLLALVRPFLTPSNSSRKGAEHD